MGYAAVSLKHLRFFLKFMEHELNPNVSKLTLCFALDLETLSDCNAFTKIPIESRENVNAAAHQSCSAKIFSLLINGLENH